MSEQLLLDRAREEDLVVRMTNQVNDALKTLPVSTILGVIESIKMGLYLGIQEANRG